MKHTQPISCPYCQCNDLQKNGKRSSGIQRWLCKGCRKGFQQNYKYKAREPGVKEQIYELTLNSSGVRDTARVLGINKNTVIAHLKKNASREPLFT